jgi:hypothetical protein
MRPGWLLFVLAGCGGAIGDDDTAGDDVALTDAAVGGSDAAARADAAGELENTVFAVPDVVDTFLRLSDPTLNYGGSARMCSDTTTDDRRILLRFDVSSLPVGAEIASATVRLWTGTLTNDLSPQTYSAYQVLEAWDEGAEIATAGSASWNERQPGVAWTVAGAGSGSRGDVVMGSFVPAANDTEYDLELDPELVAGWTDDRFSNFGIVIVGAGSDGACFATTESPDPGKHPILSVNWRVP